MLNSRQLAHVYLPVANERQLLRCGFGYTTDGFWPTPEIPATCLPCSDAAAFYIHRREHDESQHEGKAADQNR